MFTVLDAPQRSEAWKQARVGRLTASSAADMLSSIKSGEAAGRRNLRMRLVLERLTGKPYESDFTTEDIKNGIAREPLARERYEQETGVMVKQVGFLSHNELMAGASPDGLIYEGGGLRGVLEIKCRNAANHYEALTTKIPPKAMPQLLHTLWLSGAEYADYISFNPDFPEGMQFVASRLVAPDLKDYDAKVRTFLAEVDAEVEKARTYANR